MRERNKREIVPYLKEKEWYGEFVALANKYNTNKAYVRSVLNGEKYEHTIISAFPFKDLDAEEKEKWINRHYELYNWFLGLPEGIFNPDPKGKAFGERVKKNTKKYKRKERRLLRALKAMDDKNIQK